MARSTTLTNEAIWEHTGSERSQIADLVESLSEQQLDAPSLCSDWRIRDVAGHIAWVALSSPPQVAQAVLLGGFKLNAVMTERAIGAGSIPIDRLVAQLRKGAVSRIAAPGFPPIGYLADVVIHHSDMTRPLGLDHTIPEERLVAALGRALTSNRFTSGRSRTKASAWWRPTWSSTRAPARRSLDQGRHCCWRESAGPSPWRSWPAMVSRC